MLMYVDVSACVSAYVCVCVNVNIDVCACVCVCARSRAYIIMWSVYDSECVRQSVCTFVCLERA